MQWNTSPAPKDDGRKLIVTTLPTEEHPRLEEDPPALILAFNAENKRWVDGMLAYGNPQGEDDNLWDFWMELPEIPDGEDLRGWTDSTVESPKQDGTWYLVLFEHAGQFYHAIVAWQDNWAATDLEVPGVWTNGLLGNTTVEPRYWREIPEIPT